MLLMRTTGIIRNKKGTINVNKLHDGYTINRRTNKRYTV